MSGHTALILGAGAGLHYGLPLGSQLVEKICELLPATEPLRMGEQALQLPRQSSIEDFAPFHCHDASFTARDVANSAAHVYQQCMHLCM